MRAFEDPDIAHVEGDVDPVRDLQIIHEELRLKDEEILAKQLEAAAKAARSQDKTKARSSSRARSGPRNACAD